MVSQEEYDALKNSYDALEQNYAAVIQELEEIKLSILAPEVDNSEPEQNEDADSNSNEEQPTPAGDFDADKIINELNVTEYHLDRGSRKPFVFLEIENTSEFPIEVLCNLKTFDDENNMLNSKNAS